MAHSVPSQVELGFPGQVKELVQKPESLHVLSCKFLFLAPLLLFLSRYLGFCAWNDSPLLISMQLVFDMGEFRCK